MSEGVTVKSLCNAFLNHKKAKSDAAELAPLAYQAAAMMIIERFGTNREATDLGQDDFAELRKWMAKKWGAVRLRNVIQQVRSVFKYGHESELLAVPARFGPGFASPSKKTIRLNRATKGAQMFEPRELWVMISGPQWRRTGGTAEARPSVSLKAMILLGVNCGVRERRLWHAPATRDRMPSGGSPI